MTRSKPTSRIGSLHGLAVSRGFPRDQVHDLLHDAAVRMFGVSSMKQCNARQLDEIERWIRSHGQDPAHAAGHRGERSHRGERRHARGSDNAAMKVASPAQRRLIAEISGELGWDSLTLDARIKHHLGLDAVRTATEAARVIRLLIGFNRQNRRGPWRGPRQRSNAIS